MPLTRVAVGDTRVHRPAFVRLLAAARAANPSLRVIDVGGTAGGWTHGVVDAIVDFVPPPPGATTRHFSVNLNREEDWAPLLAHVAAHGKFDVAICSHTLEDICNPGLALRMLPRIALRGYCAVPSKHREMSHIEGPRYRGYIHHRWIYNVEGGRFVGYPKVNFLETYTDLHGLASEAPDKEELVVEWESDLPHGFVNGDYLGPGVGAVYAMYRGLLRGDAAVARAVA